MLCPWPSSMPFQSKRYDVYWTPRPGTLWDSTHRRAGCAWKEVDDAAGVALVIPMTERRAVLRIW